ncbi:hypothetical protein LAG90_17090 [Marinilongibacter aquaticus]|uniref:asparagine synthase-related protein n=1 Tax=Marinilongibacter aquaticus TaxID=2975157 RepID=UPI0021BD5FEC|nr:asparagine synthase-related protein [Marinilongibacter aquaticus]UBM58520.1 hypothetical protein LAG90_17090 [Marinilongibacter aquaticus]
MSQFLYIQQFNAPLDLQEQFQTALRQMGYNLLANGQSFMQFGKKAQFADRKNDSFLFDIFPKEPFSGLTNLQESSAHFSGVYLHKKRFSAELVRDFFGVKSLYYSFADGRLIASNNLLSVLACQSTKPEICHLKVNLFLHPENAQSAADELTFFKGIRRVLPGQRLYFQAGKMSAHTFAPMDFKEPKSKKNAVTHFRERFTRHIMQAMQDFDSPSVHLVNDLDSEYIDAILKHEAYISSPQHGEEETRDFKVEPKHLLASFKQLSKITAKPDALLLVMPEIFSVLKSASARNRILFSAYGGSNIFALEKEYVKELFKKRKFKRAFEAILLMHTVKATDADYLWMQSLVFSAQNRFLLLCHLWKQQLVSRQFVWQKLCALLKGTQKQSVLPIRNELYKKNPNVSLFEKTNRRYTALQRKALEANQSQRNIDTLESLDALAHAFKLTVDQPFLHKDLLKIAVNYPLKKHFNEGQMRGLLRESMKDLSPKYAQNQSGKEIATPFTFRTLLACFAHFQEGHKLWKFVDKEIFDQQLQAIDGNSEYCPVENLLILGKAISLGVWLDLFFAE